jgi:hypothetical protein
MISTDGNRSDLSKAAESVPVKIHGVIIAMHNILARSVSKQVILGHPWEKYARKGEWNLDDGICDITISAIDESQQVTFVTTFVRVKRNRFASSSGNLYTWLH